ncbi:MAG: TRAP transporter TatT component family protein [Candidatus Marinimicrobia bacterium]|nr:TRAP transporter TatT component family protein [Candidatus Neomarinimicrobiota bacterium]
MRLLFVFSVVLLIFNCSVNQPPAIQNPHNSEDSISLAVADSFWTLRAEPAFANRALAAYQHLSEMDSTSIELWSKLSHAYYYSAQYLVFETVQKDSLFLRGYEASQIILAQNSNYRSLLFSTGEESMAIRGLDSRFIDALYWGMANYGQWLSTKGALVRLGQRDLHWTTLEHINDLDSNYYYGAYYRYKGSLLARDPATQSDTLAIQEAFENAIRIAPEYLGNYTLMAMFYCPLTKDKDLFYQLLTRVVTANLDKSLSYYPENLFEKNLADKLMIKAEKENWF